MECSKDTAIIIIVFNVTEFIVKQIECIKRFCEDEYQIIIIDNSTIPEVSKTIQYHIKEEISCIYIKTPKIHDNLGGDSSLSHAFAANFSYSKFKNNYNFIFYLDHDAFPIKKFSVKKILGYNIIAGISQIRISKTYIWPGCLMLNNNIIDKDIVDLSTNIEFKLDTGGNTYKIIEYYGLDKCVFFNENYCENIYFKIPRYNFYAIINEMFIHFIAGSNWNKINDQEYKERIRTLMICLDEKISEK